jgi:hypothetical protein
MEDKNNYEITEIRDLNRDELVDLILMYDSYIQSANDDNRYREGWYPVCISEFLNNEFMYSDDEEFC